LARPGSASAAAGRESYAEALARAFEQAAAAVTPVTTDLLVGSERVRVRIAGDELARRWLPMVSHLTAPPDGRPSAFVDSWDGTATGSTLPLPDFPPAVEGAPEEDPLVVTRTAGLRVVYQPRRGLLTAQAPPEPRVAVFVTGVEELPWFEVAVPFRVAWSWLVTRRHRHIFHAGAVASGAGGALLVGRGGSGKSTTAVACLVAGELDYLSDDLALVECWDEPTVFSLYATAKLEPETLELLPGAFAGNPGALETTEDKIIVRLSAIAPERLRRSAPIRAIVCPRIVGSGRSRLVRASPGDGLRALAPTTVFLVQHEQAAALASIRHLVSVVPTFVLELGHDMAGVPELVRSAIESGA
jgi:hypothetical protein